MVCGLLLGRKRPQLLAKLGIPVACYGTEAPYFLDDERSVAGAYTHWFSNERPWVEALGRETPTFYLPHAWNPDSAGIQVAECAAPSITIGEGGDALRADLTLLLYSQD